MRLNSYWDQPIVPTCAKEQLTLLELTHSDNKTSSKVILALVSLIEELAKLKDEGSKELVVPILVYGEGENTSNEQTGCLMIGRLLSHLQHLVNHPLLHYQDMSSLALQYLYQQILRQY